ncbi:MAG TPA: carboxypeptidase regulatory-like domain-containing protein, partial [Terriglobales bacterium]|nr:carboxypeptidase regulatory-like domain-containing protein [Terriglobales bacterium]
MRRTSWVVLLLSFSLYVCAPVFAQKYTGTITGTVTDPQGAVVSGAQVTVKNQGTGETRDATTNASGVYTEPDLSVGTYTVSVKSPNFKEFVLKNVAVDPGTTTTQNAALVVGSTGEQVTVEASTVQVETTSGALGSVVEGNEVRELPLNGSNFVQLTQLMPGVSPASFFNVERKGLEGGVDFSVNGNNVTNNLFMVDGVNNNDIGSNRTILIYPSLMAIDEFKIVSNSYGPEYGQAAGAIVNIVTRGGTNQFHGGAIYRGRNTSLNATDYFNTRNQLPKDVFHRNDYGFNIGGPAIKDKLFFFWSEEWNKEIRGLSRTAEVPTAAERVGDFSAPRQGSFANGGACDPTPTSSFANNIIPAANLSPAGFLMLQTYPLPNIANPVGCANWGASLGSPVPWREDNVRGDFHITKTLSMMGRYTFDNWAQPYPSTLGYWGDDLWPGVESNWYQPSRQVTVKLTKLIGSTAVNDLQVSYAANAINITRGGAGVTIPANPLGVAPGLAKPDDYTHMVNNASLPWFCPDFSCKALGANMGQPLFWTNGLVGGQQITAPGGGLGGFDTIGPWHNNEQLLIATDNFSKVVGSHTFKAGFLASSNQKNERNQNASGENGAYWATQADSWGGPTDLLGGGSTSNNGLFDMLVAGTEWGWGEQSTNPFAVMRWHDYEFYAGDNWKIRRNVTLEYGLRWSFLRQPYTGNDKQAFFVPSLYTPADGSSACNGLLTTKVGFQQCQTLGFPGATETSNRALRPNNNHAIQPRLGIAWDPRGDGKMSIRAGFGGFYQRDSVG